MTEHSIGICIGGTQFLPRARNFSRDFAAKSVLRRVAAGKIQIDLPKMAPGPAGPPHASSPPSAGGARP